MAVLASTTCTYVSLRPRGGRMGELMQSVTAPICRPGSAAEATLNRRTYVLPTIDAHSPSALFI